MKNKFLLALLFLGFAGLQAQNKIKPGPKKAAPTQGVAKKAVMPSKTTNQGIFAEIETSKGKIVVQLEFTKTPITVASFISLAEGKNEYVTTSNVKNKPFYDGLKFHRVIKDFMIQGGDPLGNGSGGPGYSFKDEITDAKFDKAGILAMANSGPATNGSQFFITHKDTPWLTGKHTIFGYVTSGQNVVNNIAQDDVIKKITIKRKGIAATKFDASKVFAAYYAGKAEEDKKQAAIQEEARIKKAEADMAAKKLYLEQYGAVLAQKAMALKAIKATAATSESGLQYVIKKDAAAKKPTTGTNVYVYYAGYLEDGTLFDSNYEAVTKEFGTFDQNRANQNGYQPFPFQYGNKQGLIQGFIEAIELLNYNDKATIFIPSKLAYGERGAGNIIPPNSNIIFELEIVETPPTK